MSKNVAVFVDVANIFYAAKAAGVDIDYVTLLKASSAGRDLVRAYAYTGLDPDNENQRNFHDFLRRHGYKVVSKDIRKYGDGKVKANLDIELVVDMMKTARNLDIAIVVSGDGDFAPAIRAVQEQGVRVEVVSFRGNTSSDLMDVADQFTDITQIAKVEKGSSRSGRRVADDDADLSMTEVPDKQSEGTGDRARGRGRTRRGTATVASGTRGRSRSGIAASRDHEEAAAARDASDAPLVVLPGEKLSRAARPAALAGEMDTEADDLLDGDLEDEAVDGEGLVGEPGEAAEAGELGEDGRRRRRRRGGRGRGRGRGREGAEAENGQFAAPPADRAADRDVSEDEEEVAPRTTRRSASTFGSVWDSQIGAPAASTPRAPILDDDDDLEEPEIPEYLLTERRQRDSGRGRGGAGRGRGGAYAAALDRERFGGGRGSTPSRFGEPAPRREGAFGRPDRDRDRGGRGDRDRGGDRDRQAFRQAPRQAPRGTGDEPWSEVPPEIEAMLRAQMGSRAGAEPRRLAPPVPPAATEPLTTMTDAASEDVAEAEAPARRTRSRRATAAATDTATAPEATADDSTAPAKPTRTRTRKPAAEATTEPATEAATATTGTARSRRTRGSATTSRTTTRRTASAASTAAEEPAVAAEGLATDATAPADADAAAPKRRTTRRKVEPAA